MQVDKNDLEEALHAASHDPNVHGILIYYPCFGAAPSFYGAFCVLARGSARMHAHSIRPICDEHVHQHQHAGLPCFLARARMPTRMHVLA